MSQFIQLNKAYYTYSETVPKPVVVNVDKIDWFMDQKLMVSGQEITVLESTDEIWKKIEQKA